MNISFIKIYVPHPQQFFTRRVFVPRKNVAYPSIASGHVGVCHHRINPFHLNRGCDDWQVEWLHSTTQYKQVFRAKNTCQRFSFSFVPCSLEDFLSCSILNIISSEPPHALTRYVSYWTFQSPWKTSMIWWQELPSAIAYHRPQQNRSISAWTCHSNNS